MAGSLTPVNWSLYHSTGVGDPDSIVSTVGYDDSAWHEVELPSTVLSALVKDSIYPDPRVGMNNYLIPDVSDDFNRRLGLDRYNHLSNGTNPWQQPWWYRTELAVPANWRGNRVWLKLDGINY